MLNVNTIYEYIRSCFIVEKEIDDNHAVYILKVGGKKVVQAEKNRHKEKWQIGRIKISRKTTVSFPFTCKEISYQNSVNKKCQVVAIFAGYANNGRISEHSLYYLQQLKKVCDAIVFISDNPIIPIEISKIKEIVDYACFRHHGEYDFGSYKRGYIYAQQNHLLDNCQTLILCNDSCYGPIYPLKDILKKMAAKNVDFWGLNDSTEIRYHLQSYFLAFGNKVIESGDLYDFLKKVRKEKTNTDVVMKYETRLTEYLKNKKYISACYLPAKINEFEETFKKLNCVNKTLVCPKTLIDKYYFPLLKIKVFAHIFDHLLQENKPSILDCVKSVNSELYEIIVKDIKQRFD